MGPIMTRAIDENMALFNEKTLSLVNAIPNDIKIRNIVAYIKRNVVFSTNPGNFKSLASPVISIEQSDNDK